MVQTGEEDDFVSNPDLYQSYSEWCEQNGVTAKGQRTLTIALKGKGLKAGATKWDMSLEKTRRGASGAKLRGGS